MDAKILIILVLVIVIVGILLFTGLVDVNLPGQTDAEENADDAGTTKPGTLTVKPMPAPGADEDGITLTRPFNKGSFDIYMGKDKTFNVDLYGFVNDEPDLSDFESSDDCEDDCDAWCENEVPGCELLCVSTHTALCASASVMSSQCDAACMAAPPGPWTIACIDGCTEAFEQACNEDEFQQCKDDCQVIHYNVCTTECYKGC